MVNLIAENFSLLILLSHILLAVLVAGLVFRKTWGGEIASFLGERALLLSWLVAILTMAGSLFYSVVLGYEPCVLCWWQRIMLFPLVIILGLAWWRGERNIFRYSTPLVLLAGVISLYQTYANLGGTSLLECTSGEGACAKLYVYEFGYITIPTMALTVVAYLLVISWANKIYENRHA